MVLSGRALGAPGSLMRAGRRFSARSNNDFSPDGSDAARSSTGPTSSSPSGPVVRARRSAMRWSRRAWTPSAIFASRCRGNLPSEQNLSALVAAVGGDIGRCPAWVADMAQLLGHFFELIASLETPHSVRLRIESLADDACRRFHVDRSRLRLLCTYRGPGTEWLAEDQVNRHALATHQPNERILRFGEPRRLEPFWVAVMKGDRFPGNAGRGLVHRSPPIAGTGRRRLLRASGRGPGLAPGVARHPHPGDRGVRRHELRLSRPPAVSSRAVPRRDAARLARQSAALKGILLVGLAPRLGRPMVAGRRAGASRTGRLVVVHRPARALARGAGVAFADRGRVRRGSWGPPPGDRLHRPAPGPGVDPRPARSVPA